VHAHAFHNLLIAPDGAQIPTQACTPDLQHAKALPRIFFAQTTAPAHPAHKSAHKAAHMTADKAAHKIAHMTAKKTAHMTAHMTADKIAHMTAQKTAQKIAHMTAHKAAQRRGLSLS